MTILRNIGMLLTLSCRHASRLLSQAQDVPLTGFERWALRLHLLSCRSCRRFSNQLVLLRRVLRTYLKHTEPGQTRPPLTPSQRQQLLQRIARALRRKS